MMPMGIRVNRPRYAKRLPSTPLRCGPALIINNCIDELLYEADDIMRKRHVDALIIKSGPAEDGFLAPPFPTDGTFLFGLLLIPVTILSTVLPISIILLLHRLMHR